MMRYILSAVWVLLLAAAVVADGGRCQSCHRDWEEVDGPAHKFARDIHAQKGLDCYDCHGGNPAADDMDDVRKASDYRGIPDHPTIPDFCARCHADAAYMHEHNPSLPVDQMAKYKTSRHGQRLYGQKDLKVATCVSCHWTHEIGEARLPHSSTYPQNIPATCGRCHADPVYMAEYSISTSQIEEFRKSVHGVALLEKNDLGAPACNDCHGNHSAMPPGVTSLAAVCGLCHAIEAELFEQSPHMAAFRENDLPMCETCHSNHDIAKPTEAMIGSGEASVCINCHSPNDGTGGALTADSLLAVITGLTGELTRAREILGEAIAKGMMTTDEEFLMKEAGQILIQTRALVHTVDAGKVAPKAAEGVNKAGLVADKSADLIDEYYFRRQGLAVASLIITFLAIMLYRKIRRIEKSRKSAEQ